MSNTSWIKEMFEDVQTDLQHNLKRASRGVEHPGTKGDIHEDSWIDILRDYLPNRYAVDKGIVIDSDGGKSDQIDIIIYDPQYTPLLLSQKNHKYIPVEAVYAVFECKPTINKEYLNYAGDKVSSVRKLKRTSIPIEHAGGTFPAKELFTIIGGILAAKTDWVDGISSSSFSSNLPQEKLSELNMGCALSNGSFVTISSQLEINQSGTSLMFFLFTLLSALQSLGTVPAIDWGAYANIFTIND